MAGREDRNNTVERSLVVWYAGGRFLLITELPAKKIHIQLKLSKVAGTVALLLFGLVQNY